MVATSATERLEKVAGKQDEWKNLSVSRKLELIDGIITSIQGLGLEGWMENSKCVAQLYSVPLTSPCGEYVVAEETMISISNALNVATSVQDAYKIRLGEANPVLTELKMDKAVNGQVKAKVFPLRPKEIYGPNQQSVGEIWFQPNVEIDQIRPFSFEALEHPTNGALLILGAGNHDFLTIVDVFQGLFATNQVVYLKLHPLRNHLEKVIRQIFAPLIQEGYFDVEPHESMERTAELLYSESVGAVHMTGGKATHDAIVWGTTPEERQDRIARQDPKLKARMTSELGCVTPWIFAAADDYTPEELTHQAKSIYSAIHFRGSANCNSPNMAVIAKSWTQRDEFVETVLQFWKDGDPPLVYYPGAKERWQALQEAYPSSSRVIESQPSDDERTTLPLLVVDIEVDVSTSEGVDKAKSEYAFSRELFAPALVIVVIDDTKEEGVPFLELAAKFCNEFLFGTLSCSFTVPTSLEGTKQVEEAIANLKYGTIAMNVYSGMAFGHSSLRWGAIPGERLDNVQSGIGVVMNYLFLPNVEKCVYYTSIIDPTHLIHNDKAYQEGAALRLGISQFLLQPTVAAEVQG